MPKQYGRVCVSLIACIAGSAVAVGAAQEAPKDAEVEKPLWTKGNGGRWHHRTNKCSFVPPAGWKLRENTQFDFLHVDQPDEPGRRTYTAGMIVQFWQADSLDAYVKAAEAGAGKNPRVKLISSGPFETTSGVQGHCLTSVITMGNLKLKHATHYFFQQGMIVSINASATPTRFQKTKHTMDAAVRTFQFDG